MAEPTKPKVFISYAWEDPQAPFEWIEALAHALEEHEIEVILDRWHLEFGGLLPAFMESSIKEANYTLLICTKRYKEKADNMAHGLHYEESIIKQKLYKSKQHSEFIPLLKGSTGDEAIPLYKEGALYADFRQCDFNSPTFEQLVNQIHGRGRKRPTLVRPAPAPTPRPNVPPQAPKHKDTRTDFGIEMVFLKEGSFLMGDDKSKWDDEKDAHHVEIKEGFWLGKYPVTQGQFKKFVEATKYKTDAEKNDGTFIWKGKEWEKDPKANWQNIFVGDKRPVVGISWNDAMAFCMYLNEKIGKDQYRLPTEEEWEYACRAGTTTAYSFGDDERKLKEYAVFNAKETADVGSRQPNPWGLYDMHGNVWEWCYSEWTNDYKLAHKVIVPSKILAQDDMINKSNNGNLRILLRGGSWYYNFPGFLRSAVRYYFFPDFWNNGGGFRLLCTL